MDGMMAVLYTPAVCPMDSNAFSLDPAISDGPSRHFVKSLLESIGHDWIPLLIQAKSSESPLTFYVFKSMYVVILNTCQLLCLFRSTCYLNRLVFIYEWCKKMSGMILSLYDSIAMV